MNRVGMSMIQKQKLEEGGMTRKEIEALLKLVSDSFEGAKQDREAEVLRDQLESIAEQEKISLSDCLLLLNSHFRRNALARCHYYWTAREMLQGFYNWLRNEENELLVSRYKHHKY